VAIPAHLPTSGSGNSRAGHAGGFLSRMWGAATSGSLKIQSHGKDSSGDAGLVEIVEPPTEHVTSQGNSHGQGTLRRLVLVHPRSSILRNGEV